MPAGRCIGGFYLQPPSADGSNRRRSIRATSTLSIPHCICSTALAGSGSQLGDAPALQHFIDYLRSEAVIPAEANTATRETEVQRCVLAYERYLREARGLAPTTILSYAPFIRTFLEHRFGTDRVRLSTLRAVDVVEFVQCMAPTMKKKRAKIMTSALRSFLHYACCCGEGVADLVASVPVVRELVDGFRSAGDSG